MGSKEQHTILRQGKTVMSLVNQFLRFESQIFPYYSFNVQYLTRTLLHDYRPFAW